ncbi:ferredoxin-thioredoxin reductase catalytic domain-containing protein [Myxosarcina sp. GI1(2024)]
MSELQNSNLATERSLKTMKNFAQKYAERTNTYFCVDSSITAVVIEGLAKHKDDFGSPLCPCRHYEDKEAEVKSTYWNCPCVPMQERKECHCMLFLTPDNEFAGDRQDITLEEIRATTNGEF